MHELSLMDDLVGSIAFDLPAERVLVVRLVVGAEAGVLADALRFCFDVCTRGTTLEGASLDIEQTTGRELRLKEVEVA